MIFLLILLLPLLTVATTCHDYAACTQPHLFLRRNMTIHLCPPAKQDGVRFRHLVEEGLALHPAVHVVTSVQDAEYVFWSPIATPPSYGEACWGEAYRSGKLVILDESDSPRLLRVYLDGGDVGKNVTVPYFKRSFVTKTSEGLFHSIQQRANYYPLTYSILEGYLRRTFARHGLSAAHSPLPVADSFRILPWHNRTVDIACTLRTHNSQPARTRTLENLRRWQRNDTDLQHLRMQLGEVDGSSRRALSQIYFDTMRNSRVVVATGTSHWEGDFRLWESFASGALVLVDPLYVPLPFPPAHQRHVLYFDHRDPEDLRAKLKWALLENPEEADRIARRGFHFALRYHRSVNMIDYILYTLHGESEYEYAGARLVQRLRDAGEVWPHASIPPWNQR